MKILILEDSIERLDFFREKLKAYELHIFNHAKDAIEYVQNNTVDLAFLDHDLENQHHISPELPITGSEFTRFIVEHNLMKDTTIIIHSMDAVGSEYMYSTLKKAGYKVERIPFYLLKFNPK